MSSKKYSTYSFIIIHEISNVCLFQVNCCSLIVACIEHMSQSIFCMLSTSTFKLVSISNSASFFGSVMVLGESNTVGNSSDDTVDLVN